MHYIGTIIGLLLVEILFNIYTPYPLNSLTKNQETGINNKCIIIFEDEEKCKELITEK